MTDGAGGDPSGTVTDPDDPRAVDFRDLRDADRPERRGIVIAEGVNVVTRLAASAYPVRAVLGLPDRLAALDPVLAPGVARLAVDKWTLSEIVGFRVTRGVVASADRLPPREAAGLVASARRVAVLEGLNDFENLGALFRNAAAFGLDAVLLDPTCADPLYRRSVRVSMGHVLRVPFAVDPDPVAVCRAHGITTLALTPAGDTVLADRPAPGRWAVLLGAEGPGLSDATLAAADHRVRIPMAADVDSLNVATAAAVAFSWFSAGV